MNTLKDKTESELLWDQHDLYWENAPKKRSNFSENIQAIRQNRQQQLQRDLNKTKQENSEKTIVNEIINNLNLPSSAIIKNN